ncbi:MAG: NUDIX domain-containing protein [Chlorobi bacterium CHB2]|nr:NUDIX domain-containing protein [Chlorobi bacterium CHB2]
MGFRKIRCSLLPGASCASSSPRIGGGGYCGGGFVGFAFPVITLTKPNRTPLATIATHFVQVHPIRLGGGGVEHLLLRRAGAESVYPGIWQVVTGRSNPGETTLQTALRETVEEIGILPIEWHASPHVCSFYFQLEDAIVLAPVIICLLPSDASVLLSEEHCEYSWITAAEAVSILPFQTHRDGVAIAEEWGISLLKI